jgi:hypothetical protein
MKNRLLILLCAVTTLSPFAASTSVAGVSVGFSVGVFEGPLSACGYWADRAPYGRCWHPAYVASSWRPYCNGYWMWTDDGWYWASDEPWAWACYHYGRWVDDPYYGWIWVPDTVWGPSWVAWRSSDDYVGWAPLSPECRFGVGGELVFREEFIRPRAFVFVGVHHFGEPVSPHTVIVNNTTIINKTVDITKITRVNNVVVNNGPNVRVVQRYNQRKFTVAPQGMPRWTGVATPRHPTPAVLQPSAVSTSRETGHRFNTQDARTEAARPRAHRVESSPVVQEPSAAVPPANERLGGRTSYGGSSSAPSQEPKYQNFGPVPYPYGRAQQSAYSEPPKAQPEQHSRSDQSSREDAGNRQDRAQRRGQGD